MAELRDILIRPILSEKASSDQMMGNNIYAFQVGLQSNKPQIKQAIETFFNVKVSSVRTMIMYGERKRFGRFSGKQSNWKKAYVKLAEGYSLQHLFIGEEEE